MTIENSVRREDLLWSSAGDFVFESGDIKDSRGISGVGFLEEVERRLKSSFGDWKTNETDGANMHLFRGRNNDDTTWSEISNSIIYGLTYDGFLASLDFEVFIAPVSYSEVAIRIEFTDNIKNMLDHRVQNIKIVYNLMGSGPYIMR